MPAVGDAKKRRPPRFIEHRLEPDHQYDAGVRAGCETPAMTESNGNPVPPEQAAALETYLDGQSTVAELRRETMPGAPWPADDNAMLAYLLHTARSRFESGPDAGDLRTVLVWLAAHAWFEGGIDRAADISAVAASTAVTTTRRPSPPS